MPSTLEVWRPEGCQRFSLDGEPCTIGSAASSDVVLASDDTVSRLHAILEQVGDSWCLRDLASRNGTTVNGERLITQRPLHDRDEIRLGRTRLVFRADPAVDHGARTATAQAAPSLTRRERDVLDALCRPVLRGDVFTEPSSIREIAAALVVTEAAVKQHLARLYDKFIIPEEGERRRVRLANAAIRRGAVALPNLLDD